MTDDRKKKLENVGTQVGVELRFDLRAMESAHA